MNKPVKGELYTLTNYGHIIKYTDESAIYGESSYTFRYIDDGVLLTIYREQWENVVRPLTKLERLLIGVTDNE